MGLWVWDPWGNDLEEAEGKFRCCGTPVAAIWLLLESGSDRTGWDNLSDPHRFTPIFAFSVAVQVKENLLFMWDFGHMSEEPYECSVCKRLLWRLVVSLQPCANQLKCIGLFISAFPNPWEGFFTRQEPKSQTQRLAAGFCHWLITCLLVSHLQIR